MKFLVLVIFFYFTTYSSPRAQVKSTLDSAKKIINITTATDSTILATSFFIADTYMDMNQYDSAQIWLNKIHTILPIKTNSFSNYYLISRQAEVYYYNNLQQVGLQESKRGLEMAKALNDSFLLADSYNFLGLFYLNVDSTYASISNFEEGIRYLKKNPATSKYLSLTAPHHLYGNLSEAYFKQKNYDKSLSAAQISYANALKINNVRGMAIAHMSIGDVFAAINKIDSAIYYYESALTFSNKNGDNDIVLLTNGNLAKCFMYNRNSSKGSRYLHTEFSILQNNATINSFYALQFLKIAIEVYTITISIETLYANAPAAAVPINRYEFFVDSVGNNNTQPLAFTTALQHTTTSTAINLAGVLPGAHTLYARVYDVNNVASITNIGPFAMEQVFRYTNTPIPAAPLQNMEYYIDTDPGYGLATPIAVNGTNTTEVFNNISVAIPNNLAAGAHIFHIRSKQNPWSIDNALPFQIGTVVPVTWLYVKAQLVANTTQVHWATASESNTKNFVVEWSTNGVSFAAVGNVNAAGNSSNVSSYNNAHINPASGINYYRIKQVDADGRFTYSAIVKINNIATKQLVIYPNPATTFIQLNLRSKIKTLVQIFDAQGRQVITQYISNPPLYKVDISALSKGKYMVQVSDGVTLQTGGFIKQ